MFHFINTPNILKYRLKKQTKNYFECINKIDTDISKPNGILDTLKVQFKNIYKNDKFSKFSNFMKGIDIDFFNINDANSYFELAWDEGIKVLEMFIDSILFPYLKDKTEIYLLERDNDYRYSGDVCFRTQNQLNSQKGKIGIDPKVSAVAVNY